MTLLGDPNLTFFPEYLQRAGYETAFVGKWHMRHEGDDPQPGFDHWVSFKGQGSYLPSADGLNVNGRRVPQKGYITDELTEYALDRLNGRKADKPFMLYLSHKAVHADFIPAERHKGRYAKEPFQRNRNGCAERCACRARRLAMTGLNLGLWSYLTSSTIDLRCARSSTRRSPTGAAEAAFHGGVGA